MRQSVKDVGETILIAISLVVVIGISFLPEYGDCSQAPDRYTCISCRIIFPDVYFPDFR